MFEFWIIIFNFFISQQWYLITNNIIYFMESIIFWHVMLHLCVCVYMRVCIIIILLNNITTCRINDRCCWININSYIAYLHKISQKCHILVSAKPDCNFASLILIFFFSSLRLQSAKLQKVCETFQNLFCD